jgi:probable phosphoglycerate mutase
MSTEPEGHRQWRYVQPTGATSILLVRHGESAAAVPGSPFPLRDGHGDPPLHAEGERQADALGARLAAEHAGGRHISAIYVTTLQRTHQTAAPLATRLGLEPVVVPELREVFLGEWEGGLLRQKAAEGDPIVAQVYEEERWDAIPGAEPAEAFDARLADGIDRITAAHPDQLVVAVVHGGVIGQLLARATGSTPFTFAGADNGSISELVVTPSPPTSSRKVTFRGGWHVRRYNDTAHLS